MTLGSVWNDSGLNCLRTAAGNSGVCYDIEKRYHIILCIASFVTPI